MKITKNAGPSAGIGEANSRARTPRSAAASVRKPGNSLPSPQRGQRQRRPRSDRGASSGRVHRPSRRAFVQPLPSQRRSATCRKRKGAADAAPSPVIASMPVDQPAACGAPRAPSPTRRCRRTGTATPRRRSASTRRRTRSRDAAVGVKWPAIGADQADDQEDRADDHVGAVEAGRHEEGRAVDVAGVSGTAAWLYS